MHSLCLWKANIYMLPFPTMIDLFNFRRRMKEEEEEEVDEEKEDDKEEEDKEEEEGLQTCVIFWVEGL